MNDEPDQAPQGPPDSAITGLIKRYWRLASAFVKAHKTVFLSVGVALFISAGLIFFTPLLLPQSLRSLDRLDGPYYAISADQKQRAALDNPQHYFNLSATIQRPNELDCGADWTAYLLSLGGLLGFNASAVSEVILEVEISGSHDAIHTLPLIQVRRTGQDLDACSVVGYRDEITLFEDWMAATPDTKVSVSLLRRSGSRFSALNIMRSFGLDGAPQGDVSWALTSEERERLSQYNDRIELNLFNPDGAAAEDQILYCLGEESAADASEPGLRSTCNTPVSIRLNTRYLRSHLGLRPQNRPWAPYGPEEAGGVRIDLRTAYQKILNRTVLPDQAHQFNQLRDFSYLADASTPIPESFYSDLRQWIDQSDGQSRLDYADQDLFDTAAYELEDWFLNEMGFHHDDVAVAAFATLEGSHHRLNLRKLSHLSTSRWLQDLTDDHDLESMLGQPCGALLSLRTAPCPTRAVRSHWHDVCEQNATAGQHDHVRLNVEHTAGAVDGVLDRVGPVLQTLRQTEEMGQTCQVTPDFTIEILDDQLFPAATRNTLRAMIDGFETGSVLSGEQVRAFLNHLTPDRARCGYTRSTVIETHGDMSELYFLMELPSVMTSLQSALSRGDAVQGYVLGDRNAPRRYYVPVHAEFRPGAKGDLEAGWVLQTLRFGAPEALSGEPEGWPLEMDHPHCQGLTSAL